MNLNELKEYLKSEENKTFQGWDFSYIKDRSDSEPLPWDYKEIVLQYLEPSNRLLDMGTGGGEFLLALNHPYQQTSVTEAFPPNVELCKTTLRPLGIDVRQIFDDSEIPFDTSVFDIVINRHESYDVDEVNRILKSGGYFITQQVGGKNNYDLSQKLIKDYAPQFLNHNLENNIDLLKNSGFEILFSNEVFVPMKFYDLGALVYYAKIIEWEFPNFSVDNCFEILCELQNELQEQGYISTTEHRFIIIARKKK